MENGRNPELCPICQKELGTKVTIEICLPIRYCIWCLCVYGVVKGGDPGIKSYKPVTSDAPQVF